MSELCFRGIWRFCRSGLPHYYLLARLFVSLNLSLPLCVADFVALATADGASLGFAAPLSLALAGPANGGLAVVRAFLPVSGAAAMDTPAGAGFYMTGGFSGIGSSFSFCTLNVTAAAAAAAGGGGGSAFGPIIPPIACTPLVDAVTGSEGLASSFGANGAALALFRGNVYIAGALRCVLATIPAISCAPTPVSPER